jgi:Dolichyl-phosphate-mannose-protein mannosyltransferase
MIPWHRFLLPLVMSIVLGWLLGGLGFALLDKHPAEVQRVQWAPNSSWLAPPQPAYRFYVRKTLLLNGPVKAAWLQLSADNDFRLYVNGKSVAREVSNLNNSLGLAARLSTPNQYFNDIQPYRVNVGVNYHLANNNDWRLAPFIDLTNMLRPGKNVIALEIQKGQKIPRFAMQGAIYPVSKEAAPIDLTSAIGEWRVSLLSESHYGLPWYATDFPDTQWPFINAGKPITEEIFSRLSTHLFDQPLLGNWIGGSESAWGEVNLTRHWQLESSARRTFLRFACNGECDLLLNDTLLWHSNFYDKSALHMFDVTSALKQGEANLRVRLARPLNRRLDTTLPRFWLDGWAETSAGVPISPLSTDDSWTVANTAGGVIVDGPPKPHLLGRIYEGDGYLRNYPDYLSHFLVWSVGGILIAVFLATVLGWLAGAKFWWGYLAQGSGLLLPGTLWLIGVSLFQERFAQAEWGLWLVQSESPVVICIVFLGITSVSLLWASFKVPLPTLKQRNLPGWLQREFRGMAYWQWLMLAIVMIVGFSLRIYHLDFTAIDSDENTSLDATRGILRTGAPVATSGIFYTRGPFYHYMLAFWLRIVGDSAFNARFLSTAFGTMVLAVIFFFALQLTSRYWLSLSVVALLCIDPWELLYSRNIRFYELVQLTFCLSLYCFWKGFIVGRDKKFQYLFFLFMTISLLTQEVTITLLPCFLIGFFYFYRPFQWSKDWDIVAGFSLMMGTYLFDGLVFSLACLTPWVALSSTTESQLRLHISDVTSFALGIFFGSNRMYVIYTLGLFIGLFNALRQKDGKLVFLYSTIFVNLLSVTVLVFQVGARYYYPIYPLYILLSVYGLFLSASSLGQTMERFSNKRLPLKIFALSSTTLLILVNLEPQRILSGYTDEVARQTPEVFKYIKTHWQPGDVVMANLPSAAAIHLGKLDYYLPPLGQPKLDGLYAHNGRVIDRWGGGEVITNLDQMSSIFAKAKRIWIQIDDNERSKDPDLAHLYDYFTTLGEPAMETYGVRLRLWEQGKSWLPNEPNQGRDLGVY